MDVRIKSDYQAAPEEQQLKIRDQILAGLEQIKNGKTKDFNKVCDRLEKKYIDAALHN